MRFLFVLFAWALVLVTAGNAAPEPQLTAPSEAPDFPGYELRPLTQQKHVLFRVGEAEVEVAVPLFVYCPKLGISAAAQLVRDAQTGLQQLAAKPEWTAAELRAVMAALAAGVSGLEAAKPSPAAISAGK